MFWDRVDCLLLFAGCLGGKFLMAVSDVRRDRETKHWLLLGVDQLLVPRIFVFFTYMGSFHLEIVLLYSNVDIYSYVVTSRYVISFIFVRFLS